MDFFPLIALKQPKNLDLDSCINQPQKKVEGIIFYHIANFVKNL